MENPLKGPTCKMESDHKKNIGSIVKSSFYFAFQYISREKQDPQEFVNKLSPEEKNLLRLKRIYKNWGPVMRQIADNLRQNPLLNKIRDRAYQDLQRVVELAVYESLHRVNLSEYCREF